MKINDSVTVDFDTIIGDVNSKSEKRHSLKLLKGKGNIDIVFLGFMSHPDNHDNYYVTFKTGDNITSGTYVTAEEILIIEVEC